MRCSFDRSVIASRSRRAGWRPLSDAECALASRVFGVSLDPERVRLYGHGWLNVARVPMAPFGQLYFPRDWYCRDFAVQPLPDSAVASGLRLFNTFVHELVHAWQYQNGCPVCWRGGLIVITRALRLRREPYHYRLDPAATLGDYGLEQQASLIADYVTLAERPGDPRLWQVLVRDNVSLFEAGTRYSGRDEWLARYERVLAPLRETPQAFCGRVEWLGRLRSR
ncbi:hypothetical protein QU487_02040 [Crenobacter sp. SG2305]|uniref:hypothetical protein n=1 Tax=Crenobacter oryzisoli TaxID=3056844 RepID=UPI0025AA5A7E|nr:hypothetical protein [Crenobacter sp. SG2305]MDN0081540.1 hypothetical protein [Crenobacter sp. SG2305]